VILNVAGAGPGGLLRWTIATQAAGGPPVPALTLSAHTVAALGLVGRVLVYAQDGDIYTLALPPR
jgi:hypothetical protein